MTTITAKICADSNVLQIMPNGSEHEIQEGSAEGAAYEDVALGLTQEEFSARFHIPLGTLRDWEQGKTEPDQSARAYLRAIAGDAAAVQRALETGPAPRYSNAPS